MIFRPPMTTAAQALDHFTKRSNKAKKRYDQWVMTPGKEPVVRLVMSHETATFEALSVSDVTSVARTTHHALGDSSSKRAQGVAPIRDWNPNYAFVHILHHVTETIKRVPTWQEFRDVAATDPEVRSMLWEPAQEAIRRAVRHGCSVPDARNAMRYRIGNAYYSFLREAFVCAALRENDIPVRYHALADALFRVDLYTEEININLYVGNAMYKKDSAGRKIGSIQLLSDAVPAFASIDLQLPTQHAFGCVHLPSMQAIQGAVTAIRKRLQLS